MEYCKLGASGLRVSPVCLGTMMFANGCDEAGAAAMLDAAREAGVNFVDTADAYTAGRSEEMLGRLIAGDRDRWVLASKVANPMPPDDPNRRGTSRSWILRACEESLRRLGTDRIDLYYLHKEDHGVPLAETVRAMADLVRAGKIVHFGVSNYRSWRVAEICRLCDEAGIDRPAASQPYYNAMNRQPEVEHLPACGYYGLGVFPYSPLARGVLTGKYQPNVAPAEGTRAARKDRRMLESEWRHESIEIAQKLKEHAEAKGATAVDLAVGWVLNNRLITGCVAGPRTLEQWQSYIKALDYRFTAEDEALVDGLVASGHPSTPGYNDPQYPLEGRVPRTG